MAQRSSRRATVIAPDDKGIDFAAGWCTTGPVSDARSAANCNRCGQPATRTMRQKGRAPARAPGWRQLQKAGREAPLPSVHSRDGALFRRRFVHLGDVVPVDEILEERLEVIGTPVAIVDVVGVLPHVAAENGRGAVHQRILAVRRLRDGELAVLDREPAPAGAELGDAGLDEIFLELGDRADVGGDLLFELAGNLVAAAA